MALSGSFTLTRSSGTQYVQGTVSWTATQSATGNYSDVTTTLTMRRTNSGYTTYGTGTFTISTNGTSKSSGSGAYEITQTSWKFKGSSYSLTQTVRVPHNSNGTKSFTISASYSGDTPIAGSGSKEFTLNTIDRNAPTVKGSVSYKGSGNITITATSNYTANKWEYKVGSNAWTQYSTTSGTSATTSQFSPGTSSYTAYVRATRSHNGVAGTSSAFTIDLTAPTVTFTTSSITDSSVQISASSTYACNSWEYRVQESGGSWSSYTAWSTTSASSATKTITGLDPATTYNIQVRARRTSNLVYGTASSKSITTLGGSLLTSVPNLAIDASTSITLGVTVYVKTYYHRLYIYNGSTSMGSVDIGQASATGSTTLTANLSSNTKNNILGVMSGVTSKSFTYTLQTFSSSSYSSSSQIGNDSNKTGTITVSSANSGPTFTGGLTCTDTNATVTALTGGDAFIQSASSLKVEFTSATARNSASISSYSTTVGSKSVSGASPVSFGTVGTSGSTVSVNTTVTDSRGFTASQTQTINVLAYATPVVNNLTIARVNNYEEVASVVLQGSYSPVTLDGTDLNAIQSISYHKRIIGATTWDTDVDVTSSVTIDTSAHTFSWNTNTFEDGSLVRTDEYEFEFTVADKLGSRVVARQIPTGTPVLSLRKAKVGINNPNPGAALEVGNNLLYADETMNSVGINAIPTHNNALEVGVGAIHCGQIDQHYPNANDAQLIVHGDSDGIIRGRHILQGSTNRWYFRSSRPNTGEIYEQFALPAPTSGVTGNQTFDVLTTKAVTASTTAYTPSITYSSGTNPTIANVDIRYWRMGNIMHIGGRFQITNLGSTSGTMRISLPTGWLSIGSNVSALGELYPEATSQYRLIIRPSGSTYLVVTTSGGNTVNGRLQATYYTFGVTLLVNEA